MIALTGAQISNASLNGKPINWWESTFVPKGSVLNLDSGIAGGGSRAYLSIAGGIHAESYLGSKASFPLGRFGGAHGDGRVLQSEDTLKFSTTTEEAFVMRKVAIDEIPQYSHEWEVGVLPGPQSVPEYITQEDADKFYSVEWEVSHNASRLGVRLIGPKPTFSRTDGGEGGSHPSNLIDNAYPIGGINFTGDSPVILTVDGPSLGGFVCPYTVPSSQLWKIGQLKPQDRVRFVEMSLGDALKEKRLIEDSVEKHRDPDSAKGKVSADAVRVSEKTIDSTGTSPSLLTKSLLHVQEADAGGGM